jgi:exopolysaccharide biosynthesis protein
MKRQLIFILGFYILLFLSSGFVLLDEFVLVHTGTYVIVPTTTTTTFTQMTTSTSEATTDAFGSTEPTTTAEPKIAYPGTQPTILNQATIIGAYHTETLWITIYQLRLYGSDVFVADVVVADAKQILSAFAHNDFGGKNVVQKVSTMAANHQAVFAINSDWASHYTEGFVIRNGQILRSSDTYRHAMMLRTDGTVVSFAEESTTVETLDDDDAWQVWSFGPVLVKEGRSVADNDAWPDRNGVVNPRSAFGFIAPGHYLFVTVDGRTNVSLGVDVEQLANIFLLLGCAEAYNFDGGSSATMWFDGEVVNHPSNGEEREVGDCVFIPR